MSPLWEIKFNEAAEPVEKGMKNRF